MKTYKIAAVNGDGVGHEIVPAGMRLIEAVAKKHGFAVESETLLYGAGHYLKHGAFLPDNGLEKLQEFDAVLFGAVGLPEVDDRLPFKDFTNLVRTAFKQYVNYRPVQLFDGLKSPLRNKGQKDIDFVIIRENNEGEFVQSGRTMYGDTPEGFAVDTNIFTKVGTRRIAKYAFELARKRRGHVTNVTKSNTMIHTLTLWDNTIAEVAKDYPDVTLRNMYIDAASANFVLHPEYFDVVLTTNMLGDILSDLGGAIMGSLGLGGSGNICPEGNFPSMFEPIHGSAPDIMGQNKANPIGQFWSAALLLEHIGEPEAAADIMRAINTVTASGTLTAELGGTASTTEITEAALAAL